MEELEIFTNEIFCNYDAAVFSIMLSGGLSLVTSSDNGIYETKLLNKDLLNNQNSKSHLDNTSKLT